MFHLLVDAVALFAVGAIVAVLTLVDERVAQGRVSMLRHEVEAQLRDAAARPVVTVRTQVVLVLVHSPAKTQQRYFHSGC